MKITIEGTPKEIADIAKELQGQHKIRVDGKELANGVQKELMKEMRRSVRTR